jgi:hypothetical protein
MSIVRTDSVHGGCFKVADRAQELGTPAMDAPYGRAAKHSDLNNTAQSYTTLLSYNVVTYESSEPRIASCAAALVRWHKSRPSKLTAVREC